MDLKRFHEVVVPETHLKLQKSLVIKLHELITKRNSEMPKHPVDLGWARFNWNQSLETTPPTDDAVVKLGEVTNIVKNAAKNISTAKPFGIIWEYNNTPYIEVLEDGHSKQASTGMLHGALVDLQEYINGLQ